MNNSKVNILDVQIDNINMAAALQRVEQWLTEQTKKHYVVTPNPEFIILAQKDPGFKAALNKADLAIPDSARLGWADKVLASKSLIKRLILTPFVIFPKVVVPESSFAVTTGVDLMENLCKLAGDRGFSIGLLGGKGQVAVKAAECLLKKYPGLKISFAEGGGEVDENGIEFDRGPAARQPHPTSSLVTTSLRAVDGAPRLASPLSFPATDILFVAFGQGKQEKWISNNLDRLPIKVAMGVGGSFDYISGVVPRAPRWLRSLGFEWLFRLILQPWRIKRQLSLFRFTWLVCKGRA